MRKTILLFNLSICLFQFLLAQNFEGKIIYHVSYKSKSPALTAEQLGSFIGTQQEYLVKGGNYKTVVATPAMLQWQLFINSENKLYNKFTNSETLLWNDAGVYADSVLAFQINKGATEVSGYKCDELVLTCKSGLQKYYFNGQFKVDPSLFLKHKYGNWYAYVSKAGALPLNTLLKPLNLL